MRAFQPSSWLPCENDDHVIIRARTIKRAYIKLARLFVDSLEHTRTGSVYSYWPSLAFLQMPHLQIHSMTSAPTRYTEIMALRKRSLEDVWFVFSSNLKKFLERFASEFSVCLMDFILFIYWFLYHISNSIAFPLCLPVSKFCYFYLGFWHSLNG